MPPSPWIGSQMNAAVLSLIAAARASLLPYSMFRNPGGKGPKPYWYWGSSDIVMAAKVRP